MQVPGERLEVGARLIARHQHEGAAGIQHGLDRAAQRILVKQRQRNEPALALACGPIPLVVGDVPEHAAVGHDGALGPAGGAGRVGLKRLRILRKRRRCDGGGRFAHLVLEREKAVRRLTEQEPAAKRRVAGDRNGIAAARRIDDGQSAGCLRNDVAQRSARKPRIERERDGAHAHGAEEELDKLGAVADQHGHALARTHAETSQHSRHGIHSRVKRAVGRTTLDPAEQIDDRHLVGKAKNGIVEEIAEIAPAVLVHHEMTLEVLWNA